MTPIVISESTVEPITLAEAAENLRRTPDKKFPEEYFEANTINRLIRAARKSCERELQMSLVAKVLEVAENGFIPCYPPWRRWQWGIELPLGPVDSIVSVKYTDTGGVEQTLATNQYRLDQYSDPPVLVAAYGVTWPTVRADINAVRVRYNAGYDIGASPPSLPPDPILQAMHLCITHWFINRSPVDDSSLAEVPLSVQYLLRTYRQGLGV